MQTEVQQWQGYTQISENLNQSWLLNTFSITVLEFSLTSKIIVWWFKSVEKEQDFEFLTGMYRMLLNTAKD